LHGPGAKETSGSFAGEARFPTIQKEILAELAKGQQPYADHPRLQRFARPAELVFDAGFGELFIVRVAGNVVSPEVMGTLQYAGVHLRTPLFVVLGHEGCGASSRTGAKFRGKRDRRGIELLLTNISPGLDGINPDWASDAQLQAGVEANVRWSMHQLLETPEAKERKAEGLMKLVALSTNSQPDVWRFSRSEERRVKGHASR
jgi:carbonic anhydrase